jgi:hypothetical protein
MTARGRLWAVIVGGALVVAATAGVAAAAGAFSNLVQRQASDTVSVQGQTASATAHCPSGLRRVSGGFESNADNFSGPVMMRSAARRRHGWNAAGNVFAPSIGENYTVTSFIYCADHAPGEFARTATKRIHKGDKGSATATCPKGTKAIAGGFATRYNGDTSGSQQPKGNLVYSSFRVRQRKWRTSATHTFQGRATRLKSIAYCGHSPRLSKRADATDINDANPVGTATATCPEGTHAVSGGFKSSAEAIKGGFITAEPQSSELVGSRSWRAVGLQPFFGSYHWKAFAYCAKR